MEFHEKLQKLRKDKNLTQEELAEQLYVSRTAISKWESGRGYPNIDSLKSIAKFFAVTVDELLSGDELIEIAEKDTAKKENQLRTLVFGLLDCGIAMLFFLPFFGQKKDTVESVSLLLLTEISSYLKAIYFLFIAVIVIYGILTLSLQNSNNTFWIKYKDKISLILNTVGVFLFIISLQPYAAIFVFLFLVIKALMLIKWR